MTEQKKKPRFTVKRWLARLERAAVSDRLKEFGRLVMKAHGKRLKWIAGWQIDGAWGDGNTVNDDLFRLKRANLLRYQSGHFLPWIGPRVPGSGEVEVTAEGMELIERMLTIHGGRDLYYLVKRGYFGGEGKTRWLMVASNANERGKWPERKAYSSRVVKPLIRKGIIESSGCTFGGFKWNLEFRVNCYRLHTVKGMPKRLLKYRQEEVA